MAPLLFGLACGGSKPADEGGAADTVSTERALPASAAQETAGTAPSTPDTGGAEPSSPAPEAAGSVPEAAGAAPDTAAAASESATRTDGEPAWMTVDDPARKVTFEIVSGLTPTNGNWNFNGFASGDMTITVPQGWTVVIDFTNRDANVPHSLLINAEAPPYPQVLPDKPGIPRAYSIDLQNGLGAGKSDVLNFTTSTSGTFYMTCGVPGHAASGMWDHFVVSSEAARPTVQTHG